MTNDGEHLLMFSFAIHIPSLVKYLFKSNTWSKIFANHISDKVFVYKYIKNSQNTAVNLKKKKKTVQQENGEKTRTGLSQRRTYRWQADAEMFGTINYREMQIGTTMRYHYTPTRMAKVKSNDATTFWWRRTKTGLLCHAVVCQMAQALGETVRQPFVIIKYVLTTWPSRVTLGHLY